MIYLDASVALAQILAEDRKPPANLWAEAVSSSRLLECEFWTRLHARQLAESHGETARALLDRVTLVELLPAVLERAIAPFPVPLRTLDALHVASVELLGRGSSRIRLATYDRRMAAAARALDIELYPL